MAYLINRSRTILTFFFAALLMLLVSACGQSEPPLPVQGPMPSLSDGGTWFNSPPLTDEDLRGKVVLVDFWTYSCINCIRAMPYVNAWYAKYRDDGFVVIGVHAPEFDFEHDSTNVSDAIRRLGISHPVVLDNDRKLWKAFDNRYWPAHYFIDAEGQIRYEHFGEGEYQKSESVIQTLLAELPLNPSRITKSDTATYVSGQGATAAADWANIKSHETYLGWGRAKGISNEGDVKRDAEQEFHYPSSFALNDWAFDGSWFISRQFAEARVKGSSDTSGITYRFHARDVNLVLGLNTQLRKLSAGSTPDNGVRFRVTLDGKSPGPSAGIDVDSLGYGVVTEDRMYQLIRQTEPVKELTFTITFYGSGVRAYAFTFG